MRRKRTLTYRIFSAWLSSVLTVAFAMPAHGALSTSLSASAVEGFNLPAPGTIVTASSVFVPPMITGLIVHPEDPFQFDFIVDSGDEKMDEDKLKTVSTKLVRYFLASLAVPENELWVNLSPYEKNRIIPDAFSKTEMGGDLLAQDYILKQFTASLVYPESDLGKVFWDKVYSKIYKYYKDHPDTCQKQGRDPDCTVGADIPIDTFNKVWIIPESAGIYEKNGRVFVVDSHLKVMLEEDYQALASAIDLHDQNPSDDAKRALNNSIVREIIIPAVEKEVNEGKNFYHLRQIYNSFILASWYKKNLKESILNRLYADQKKIEGIEADDKDVKDKIYQQYIKAFQAGVFNLIKEDYDETRQEVIPRKYFSGGAVLKNVSSPSEKTPKPRGDVAMISVRLKDVLLSPSMWGRIHDTIVKNSRTLAKILPSLYEDMAKEQEWINTPLLKVIVDTNSKLLMYSHGTSKVDLETLNEIAVVLTNLREKLIAKKNIEEVDELTLIVKFIQRWHETSTFQTLNEKTEITLEQLKKNFSAKIEGTNRNNVPTDTPFENFFDVVDKGIHILIDGLKDYTEGSLFDAQAFQDEFIDKIKKYLPEEEENNPEEFFAMEQDLIDILSAFSIAMSSGKGVGTALQRMNDNSLLKFLFWKDSNDIGLKKKALEDIFKAKEMTRFIKGQKEFLPDDVKYFGNELPQIIREIQSIRQDMPDQIHSQMEALNLLLGNGHEKTSRNFFKLASLLRMKYSYKISADDPRPPLQYAIEEGIYFKIGPDLYITPVTEAFRRALVFHLDHNGKTDYAFEVLMSGEDEAKQYTFALKRKRIIDELKENYPDQEYVINPVFLRTFPRGIYEFFNKKRTHFLFFPPRVLAFEYKYDGKRLSNVSSDVIKSWADALGTDIVEIEKSIIEQVAEQVAALHALGYVGNGFSSLHTLRATDQHLENFRATLLKDSSGKALAVKILLIGDFGMFHKSDSPEDLAEDFKGLLKPSVTPIKILTDILPDLEIQEMHTIFQEVYKRFGIPEKFIVDEPQSGDDSSPVVDDSSVENDTAPDTDNQPSRPDQLTPGGIDFNPAPLDIHSYGEKTKFPVLPDLGPLDGIKLNGLIPVIFKITPIMDFPSMLGNSNENFQQQMSNR